MFEFPSVSTAGSGVWNLVPDSSPALYRTLGPNGANDAYSAWADSLATNSLPNYAFDLNPATTWMSAPALYNNVQDAASPASLFVSLPLRIVPIGYTLQALPSGASANNSAPSKFVLYGSSDYGVTWEIVHTITEAVAWSAEETRYYPTNTINALGKSYSSFKLTLLRTFATVGAPSAVSIALLKIEANMASPKTTVSLKQIRDLLGIPGSQPVSISQLNRSSLFVPNNLDTITVPTSGSLSLSKFENIKGNGVSTAFALLNYDASVFPFMLSKQNDNVLESWPNIGTLSTSMNATAFGNEGPRLINDANGSSVYMSNSTMACFSIPTLSWDLSTGKGCTVSAVVRFTDVSQPTTTIPIVVFGVHESLSIGLVRSVTNNLTANVVIDHTQAIPITLSVSAPAGLTDTAWHVVVISLSVGNPTSSLTIYIDGALVGTSSTSGVFTNRTTNANSIGRMAGTFMQGYVRQVLAWNEGMAVERVRGLSRGLMNRWRVGNVSSYDWVVHFKELQSGFGTGPLLVLNSTVPEDTEYVLARVSESPALDGTPVMNSIIKDEKLQDIKGGFTLTFEIKIDPSSTGGFLFAFLGATSGAVVPSGGVVSQQGSLVIAFRVSSATPSTQGLYVIDNTGTEVASIPSSTAVGQPNHLSGTWQTVKITYRDYALATLDIEWGGVVRTVNMNGIQTALVVQFVDQFNLWRTAGTTGNNWGFGAYVGPNQGFLGASIRRVQLEYEQNEVYLYPGKQYGSLHYPRWNNATPIDRNVPTNNIVVDQRNQISGISGSNVTSGMNNPSFWSQTPFGYWFVPATTIVYEFDIRDAGAYYLNIRYFATDGGTDSFNWTRSFEPVPIHLSPPTSTTQIRSLGLGVHKLPIGKINYRFARRENTGFASVQLVNVGNMWFPGDSLGLQAYYAADQGVTAVSNLVSQWNDLSGNDRHFTQATTLSRPLWNWNRDQKRTIYFNNAQSVTQQWSMTSTIKDVTAFTVGFTLRTEGFKAPANSPNSHLMTTSSTDTSAASLLIFHPGGSRTIQVNVNGISLAFATKGFADGQIHSIVFTGSMFQGTATFTLYFDGIRYITTANNVTYSSFAFSKVTLGAPANDPTLYYPGGVSAFVMYERAFSLTEVQQMESYLTHYWRFIFTNYLELTHPYKSAIATWEKVGALYDLSASAKSACVAIYGFKRYFLEYTGPTVTVRRSDNATSDFYANTIGTLGTATNGTGESITSWLGTSTGYVTQWYDQSGRGKHVTQTTVSKQPVIVGTSTGDVAVYLSGSQQLAGPNVFDTNTVINMHMVTATREIVRSGSLLLSLNGSDVSIARFAYHAPYSSGTWYFDAGNSSTQRAFGGATTLGAKTIFSGFKSSTDGRNGFRNNSGTRSLSTLGAIASATVSGGLLLNATSNTNHYMYAIAVFSTSLKDTPDEALLERVNIL